MTDARATLLAHALPRPTDLPAPAAAWNDYACFRLIGDPGEELKQFASARQFGAWLGLVPSPNSTGGKARLGRITKRGDDRLRTLLIRGATPAPPAPAIRRKDAPIALTLPRHPTRPTPANPRPAAGT